MSTSIEQGTAPTLTRLQRRLLGVAATLTTPLMPDDYLGSAQPRWSARELTGTIDRSSARLRMRRRSS